MLQTLIVVAHSIFLLGCQFFLFLERGGDFMYTVGVGVQKFLIQVDVTICVTGVVAVGYEKGPLPGRPDHFGEKM